jgi:hypothetical protein
LRCRENSRLLDAATEGAVDILLDTLAQGFIARTLAKEDFTNEAHLRVGLWHLLRYSETDALALLRARIRAFNEAVGGVNSDTAGYHETITRLYLRLIADFLRSADDQRSADELADDLIASRGCRDLPLRYYSRERLFSPEARREWLPPI